MESTCSAFVCPRQSISLSPLLSSLSKKVKTIVDELFLEAFDRHPESYVFWNRITNQIFFESVFWGKSTFKSAKNITLKSTFWSSKPYSSRGHIIMSNIQYTPCSLEFHILSIFGAHLTWLQLVSQLKRQIKIWLPITNQSKMREIWQKFSAESETHISTANF